MHAHSALLLPSEKAPLLSLRSLSKISPESFDFASLQLPPSPPPPPLPPRPPAAPPSPGRSPARVGACLRACSASTTSWRPDLAARTRCCCPRAPRPSSSPACTGTPSTALPPTTEDFTPGLWLPARRCRRSAAPAWATTTTTTGSCMCPRLPWARRVAGPCRRWGPSSAPACPPQVRERSGGTGESGIASSGSGGLTHKVSRRLVCLFVGYEGAGSVLMSPVPHQMLPYMNVGTLSRTELQLLNQLHCRRKRRHRTIFTDEQLEALENLFQETKYPDVGTREQLARRVHLREEKVEVFRTPPSPLFLSTLNAEMPGFGSAGRGESNRFGVGERLRSCERAENAEAVVPRRFPAQPRIRGRPRVRAAPAGRAERSGGLGKGSLLSLTSLPHLTGLVQKPPGEMEEAKAVVFRGVGKCTEME